MQITKVSKSDFSARSDRSFDGIVASSVFEYLDDVPGMTAELARVVRPEGVMLLTVPNPRNGVRKLEAWLRSRLNDLRVGGWEVMPGRAETSYALTPGRQDVREIRPSRCAASWPWRGGVRGFVFSRLLAPALGRVPRLDSYAAYLRLSRNRFEAQEWQSLLNAAHFEALHPADFSPEAWRRQAKAPLVLLDVKRAVEQFDREAALFQQSAR